MTLKKNCKIPVASKRPIAAKHSDPTKSKRAVRFHSKSSPEVVGDSFLQSTNKRRRYMRRGSRSPNMLAIHVVRSSAEVAAVEAYDVQQEKLEQKQPSLAHVIRRSLSLPGRQRTFSKEAVNHDLARSLFHKTNLTNAQKRRLSLEILSRVQLEAGDLSEQRGSALTSL